MDPTRIFSKTGKGTRTAAAKRKELSANAYKVLTLIDSKTEAGTIHAQMGKLSEVDFSIILAQLEGGGYIRAMQKDDWELGNENYNSSSGMVVEEIDPDAFIDSANQAKAEQQTNEAEEEQLMIAAEALAQVEKTAREQTERETRAQTEREAQAAAEARQRSEAEARAQAAETARLEAERQAQQEAQRQEEARRREEVARMQAENEARRAAAERQAQEATERAAREAAEQQLHKEEEARRLVDEAVRLAIERRAREDAERQAQAENEARAKAEAEARTRAEEAARLEAERVTRETAAKQEVERLAREEVERTARAAAEQRKRDEEAAAQRAETERKAQAEAEHQRLAEEARLKAEAKAREEAEKAAQREAERLAREEAKRKEQEEKEARRKIEEARKAQEEAERQAKKAEEARLKAEAKARAEAEMAAKLETERLAREEAERNAAAEKEAKRQAEATRKAKEEAERQEEARRKAEEKARAEAEKAAQREAERLVREQEERKAREQAERRAAKLAKARAKRDTAAPGKIAAQAKAAALALGTVLALAVAVLHFINLGFMASPLERLASTSIGEPVRIGGIRAALFPTPRINLSEITIGAQSDVHIGSARAALDLTQLFDERKSLRSLEIADMILDAGVLSRAQHWIASSAQSGRLTVRRIQLKNITPQVPGLTLPAFDGQIMPTASGEIAASEFSSADHSLTLRFAPQGAQQQVEVEANNWQPPLGTALQFSDLQAQGVVSGNQVRFDRIEGHLYGGKVKAKGTANWTSGATMSGSFELDGVSLALALAGLGAHPAAEGNLSAVGTFASHASAAGKLADAAEVHATFKASEGRINGIDLASAAISGTRNNMTRFDTLTGELQWRDGVYRYRKLALDAGQFHARGDVDVQANQQIAGSINAELAIPSRHMQSQLRLGGKVGDVWIK